MTKFPTPSIDWVALSPELILLGGAAVCLLVPLFLPHGWRRHLCAFVSILSFVGAGAAATFTQPDIDWAALAPELVLLGAAAITLTGARSFSVSYGTFCRFGMIEIGPLDDASSV